MKRLLITGAGVLLVFVSGISAQIKRTENTVKLEPGKPGVAATIAEMAWLAGTFLKASRPLPHVAVDELVCRPARDTVEIRQLGNVQNSAQVVGDKLSLLVHG